jgi:hypothetical protein
MELKKKSAVLKISGLTECGFLNENYLFYMTFSHFYKKSFHLLLHDMYEIDREKIGDSFKYG